MIPINELRVGNVVINALIDREVFTIRNLRDIVYASDELKGYVLNHSLLKKCGFVDGILEIKNLDIYIEAEDPWEGDVPEVVLKDRTGNPLSIRYRYLHQLQNLYFAITGEELKHSILK